MEPGLRDKEDDDGNGGVDAEMKKAIMSEALVIDQKILSGDKEGQALLE